MSDDHKLKQDVLAELAWEPSISADHIGVTAKAGVVTLTGHVENYWQKRAAERAASRVQGVKALAEELEVRLPFSIKRSDEEIASAAISGLSWNVSVPRDAAKVKVEKGFVTLTGQVDWRYQMDAAAHAVRSLSGVTGVANQMTVKPYPSTSNIRENIRHALHRSWFFDDDNVEVSVDGGKVHLTGNVDSWYDRHAAANTAWAAPGTTSVVNDIHVT